MLLTCYFVWIFIKIVKLFSCAKHIWPWTLTYTMMLDYIFVVINNRFFVQISHKIHCCWWKHISFLGSWVMSNWYLSFLVHRFLYVQLVRGKVKSFLSIAESVLGKGVFVSKKILRWKYLLVLVKAALFVFVVKVMPDLKGMETIRISST